MLERRDLIAKVTGFLEQFPVVGLLGPRQVGKTTISRWVADLARQQSRRVVYFPRTKLKVHYVTSANSLS